MRSASAQQEGFTPDQIDNLMGPIALYPDALLAQVLPAATYVEQVQQAEKFLANGGQTAQIDGQKWDVSVKSIAHYPEVVKKMNANLDWTTQVGQAFVTQQKDVMQSIQRLRAAAKEAGTLQSNAQQKVVAEGSTIKIVPAQSTTIYVPTYDPQVVYVEQDNSDEKAAAALVGFGVGLLVGSWLNDNSCNWNSYGVYYRGSACVVNRTVVNRTVVNDVRYNNWSGRSVTAGRTYNNGTAARGAATHNAYTGRTTAAGQSYNAQTGRYAQGGASYNQYTGRASAAGSSANAYTGRTTTQGATRNAAGGTTRAGSSYNAYTGRESAGATHTNPRTGNTSGVAATQNPRTGQTHVRGGSTGGGGGRRR